jgi:DNA (cytosine-5)-methyltransferase 1
VCVRLEGCLGYRVEHRILRACDYGAPTYRRRLFVVARRDGLPIVWPSPTHGPGLRPFRTAADCIDWSVPCPSIFARSTPLAENTLARIARGLKRFVFDSPRPFIVPLTHQGSRAVPSVDEPFRTVTGANRGELALVVPTLIQTGYGEREGQAPRSLNLHKPLGTVVAGGAKHALVLAFLAKHYGGNNHGSGQAVTEPASTVTTIDHHALVTATLAPDDPQPANSLAAFIIKYFGTGTASPCDAPLPTVTTRDRFALVVIDRTAYRLVDIGMRMLTPRELARAQGFDDVYSLDATCFGERVSKTDQIKMIGNSVCPQLAEALVRTNCTLAGEAAA